MNFIQAVFRAQVIEKEQHTAHCTLHTAHCKTAEILEWQLMNEKMKSMYKNDTSVLIQEMNVSKNLTISSSWSFFELMLWMNNDR